MSRADRSKRACHLIDLSGDELRIAEGILNDLFSSAPGTEEGRKASERFAEFDRIICERDGWKRSSP